jgi:hypothetical protein
MGENRIMKPLIGSPSAFLIRFEPALSKWPPAEGELAVEIERTRTIIERERSFLLPLHRKATSAGKGKK